MADEKAAPDFSSLDAYNIQHGVADFEASTRPSIGQKIGRPIRSLLEYSTPPEWLVGKVGREAYKGVVEGATLGNVQPDIEEPQTSAEKFAFEASNLLGFGTTAAAVGIGTRTAANPIALGAILGALQDTGLEVNSADDYKARAKNAASMGAQFWALGKAGEYIGDTVGNKLLTTALKNISENPGKAAVVKRILADGVIGAGFGAAHPTGYDTFSAKDIEERIHGAAIGSAAFITGAGLSQQFSRGAAKKMGVDRRSDFEKIMTPYGPHDVKGPGFVMKEYKPFEPENPVQRQVVKEMRKFGAQEGAPSVLGAMFPHTFEGGRSELMYGKAAWLNPGGGGGTDGVANVRMPNVSGSDPTEVKPPPPPGGEGPAGDPLAAGKVEVKMASLDKQLRAMGIKNVQSTADMLYRLPAEARENALRQLRESVHDETAFKNVLMQHAQTAGIFTDHSRQKALDLSFGLGKERRTLDKISAQPKDMEFLDAIISDPYLSAKGKTVLIRERLSHHVSVGQEHAAVKSTLEDVKKAVRAKADASGVTKTSDTAEQVKLLNAKSTFDKAMETPEQRADMAKLLSLGGTKALAKALGVPEKEVAKWLKAAGVDPETIRMASKDAVRGVVSATADKEKIAATSKAETIIEGKKSKKPSPKAKDKEIDDALFAAHADAVDNSITPVVQGNKILGDVFFSPEEKPILDEMLPEIKADAKEAGLRVKVLTKIQPESGESVTGVHVYDAKKLQALLDKNKIKMSSDRFVEKVFGENIPENDPLFPTVQEAYKIQNATEKATYQELLAGKKYIKPKNVKEAKESGKVKKSAAEWREENAHLFGNEYNPQRGNIIMSLQYSETKKGNLKSPTNLRGPAQSEVESGGRKPWVYDIYTDADAAMFDSHTERLSTGIVVELDGQGIKESVQMQKGSLQFTMGGVKADGSLRIVDASSIDKHIKAIYITDKADPMIGMAWASKGLKAEIPVSYVNVKDIPLEIGWDSTASVEMLKSLNQAWRASLKTAKAKGDTSSLYPVHEILVNNIAQYARSEAAKNDTVTEAIDKMVFGFLRENPEMHNTPGFQEFMSTYSAQRMLELMRGEGIFKKGAHVEMDVIEALNKDYQTKDKVAGGAGVVFKADSPKPVEAFETYAERVDNEGGLADPIEFKVQLSRFFSETRLMDRNPYDPNFSNAENLLNIKTDDANILSKVDWFRNKYNEVREGLDTKDDVFQDIETSAKIFNEVVAMAEGGMTGAPISENLARRLAELKWKLATMSFNPKKTVTQSAAEQAKYYARGLESFKKAIQYEDLFAEHDGVSYKDFLLSQGVIVAKKGSEKLFELSKWGSSLGKEYSKQGYQAYANKRAKVQRAIELIEGMISAHKNVIEPASNGVNIFRTGKPVMSNAEYGKATERIANIDVAIEQKTRELENAGSGTPEEAQNIQRISADRDALVQEKMKLEQSKLGIASAKESIEAQKPVDGPSVSDEQSIRDIQAIARSKGGGGDMREPVFDKGSDTKEPGGAGESNWGASVTQWAYNLNRKLGSRGSAPITDETGDMFPLFRAVKKLFAGSSKGSIPEEPAKDMNETMARAARQRSRQNQDMSAVEDLHRIIRDNDGINEGMLQDAAKITGRMASELSKIAKNMGYDYAANLLEHYYGKKRLLNPRWIADSFGGKLDQNMKIAQKALEPLFIHINAALESIWIPNHARPNEYAFADDAGKVDPRSGMTKKQLFDSLSPDGKRWVVNMAGQYRVMLEKSIEMGMFYSPDKIMESYRKNGYQPHVAIDKTTGRPFSDAFQMADPSVRNTHALFRDDVKTSILDRVGPDGNLIYPEVLDPVQKMQHYMADFNSATQGYATLTKGEDLITEHGTPLFLLGSKLNGDKYRAIGGSILDINSARDLGYEMVDQSVPLTKFNPLTRKREVLYAPKDVAALLKDVMGHERRFQNDKLAGLQRMKSITRSITLWSIADNWIYTITSLNGALNAVGAAKATIAGDKTLEGPGWKSWLNFKNGMSEELRMRMAYAGVRTVSYDGFLRGLYDSFKVGEIVHGKDRGLMARVGLTLEEMAHEKGGLDRILYKQIENASAVIFDRSTKEFQRKGLSIQEADKLAADYVNTSLSNPSDRLYSRKTSEAARWMLISRNMSFSRIRMMVGAFDPMNKMADTPFTRWANRNLAHHGLTPHENKLLQERFAAHLLGNAITFGLGTAIVSYMMTAQNSKDHQGYFPWETGSPADWFRIHTGYTDPRTGTAITIKNPLMKEFTDNVNFWKMPIDVLESTPPEWMFSKMDMTVKGLIETVSGQKSMPGSWRPIADPAAPFNEKVQKVLHNMIVDNGPLNIMKPAFDELSDKETSKLGDDPIATWGALLGFNAGHSKGPVGKEESQRFMQITKENQTKAYVQKQISSEMNRAWALSQSEDESQAAMGRQLMNRLALFGAMTPREQMTMMLKKQDPLSYLERAQQRGVRSNLKMEAGKRFLNKEE